jgi:hypothetical protein
VSSIVNAEKEMIIVVRNAVFSVCFAPTQSTQVAPSKRNLFNRELAHKEKRSAVSK